MADTNTQRLRGSRGRVAPRSRRTGSIVGLTLLLASTLAAPSLASDVPGLTSIEPDELDPIVAKIEEAAALAKEELAALRSDRLEAGMVLQQTGTDPLAIRDWVAEHTSSLPYQGVLRGAGGVLMDRSGNSLDRSLLLTDLLGQAGYDVRLAHETLSADDARLVLASVSPAAGDGEDAPWLATPDEVAGYQAAVDRAAASLMTLLPPSAGEQMGPDALAAAADHWWVQADVDGEWLDLDPAGLTAASSVDVVALDAAADPLLDLRQQVTMRVVVESTQDGEPMTFVPLSYDYRLGTGDPLASFKLRFDYAFAEPPEDELDLDGMAQVVSHWRPRLSGASGNVAGAWFSSDGRPEDPAGLAANEKFGDAASALGGLGDEPTVAPESRLTGVWLEYEASGPGLAPRTVRRDLLRMAEPEPADVAAALLDSTNVLVQSAQIHPDAFNSMILQNIVDARSGLIALAHIAAGDEDERILPSLAQTKLEPALLYGLAMERFGWATDADREAMYLGRPNVWSEHLDYRRTPDGLQQGYAVDIVENGLDVLPFAADRTTRLRVRQGVLDTLAEHALAGGPGSTNTWARFDAALGTGDAWDVLLEPADLDAVDPAFTAADRERIEASVSTGHVVVLDPTSPEVGASWWQVDPVTGETLGIGHNGWGAEVPETVGVFAIPAEVAAAGAGVLADSVAAEAGATAAVMAEVAEGVTVVTEASTGGTVIVYELFEGAIVAMYSMSVW